MIRLPPAGKLIIVICLSFAFFVAEIAVGFRTSSLALIADAFHYLNDLLSFIIALTALVLSQSKRAPASLAFGWQRVRVLGAFFNGVFLLALGLSIFLQSIERFCRFQAIEKPRDVLIVGCVGLALNVVSLALVHEHHDEHSDKPASRTNSPVIDVDLAGMESPAARRPLRTHHHHDLGTDAIMMHILGDVLNNIGVIAAALIMMFVKPHSRFYADPAVSVAIAIMIIAGALPLTLKSGHILLCSTPPSITSISIREKLRAVPGIISVHDLHIWRLDQNECVASAHIIVSPLQELNDTTIAAESDERLRLLTRSDSTASCHGVATAEEQRMRREGAQPHLDSFEEETLNGRLKRVNEIFGRYGIEKVTLQIEEDRVVRNADQTERASNSDVDVERCTGSTRHTALDSTSNLEVRPNGADARQLGHSEESEYRG